MVELNYKQENKIRIEGEINHNYVYHVFTEESVRAIAAKPARDVKNSEWYTLVQMLYPENLICSGLFESFLVFDIIDGKRKDPPKEHWFDLVEPGSDGILLKRIITALEENGICVDKSWKEILRRSEELRKQTDQKEVKK